MTTRIKLRRDTAAAWTDVNPVLALGEAGYDTTNHQIRVGDGTTAWMDLHPIGGSGNVANTNGSHILWLDYGGELRAGDSGFDDINIGPTDNSSRAHILVSQDGPYIRSEVKSTTNQNYQNDMMWHASYFSRYTKFTADAYGAHIKNAQWSGPGTDYRNEWTFTRDGILDMPQGAEIRVNPIPPYVNGSNSYNSSDQNLTITANVVNISGGRLDVGGSQQGGFIGVLGPIEQSGGWDSYWYEAVATDTGGNVYVAGGSYDQNHPVIVTKYNPQGVQLWSKWLRDGNNSNVRYNGEPNSIDHDGTNVVMTVNAYGSSNSALVVYLNADTGAVASATGIADPQTDYGISVTDVAMASSFGNAPIVAGIRYGGRDFITPDVSGITQVVTNRLVVAADTFTGNLTPDPRFSAWTMFGTGITGNVAINAVNNFTSVAASRTSGSGTGTDARFDISYVPGGAYTIAIATPGTNYDNTDVLKVLGTALGGTTPANDLSFHVTTDGGTVINTGSKTGTATTRWSLGLSGDPVDFTTLATPTILVYQNQTGFMQWNGGTTIVGNVGQTQINSVAQEYNTTDGNVYVGGQSQTEYGGNYHAFVTKFNYDGGTPQWTVQVDDANHYGIVWGVVSDSDKAVVSVGDNDEGQIIVTKVDTNGTMVWQRSVDVGTNLASVYGIALGDDNSVLVTAQVQTQEGNTKYHLMIAKFTKTGDLAWCRTLGAARNAGSEWECNHRDITTDNEHFYVNGWAKGLGLNQGGSDNGFVAKFPLDGSGVGRYGDWIYTQHSLEVTVVTNTSANVLVVPFRSMSSGPEAFTVSSVSNLNTSNDGSNHIEYWLGGPGDVMGVGNVHFTNGATITTVREEGLEIWQPGPTQQQLDGSGDYAEYVSIAFGGNSAVGANVKVSAGIDGWAHDDSHLNSYNYSSNNQRQVNIDIVGSRNGADGNYNVSNWHFDEDGSVYLPAQGHYYYDGCNIQGNTDPVSGLTTWYFSRTDYPHLREDIRVGDKAFDPIDNNKWTPIYDLGSIDEANCYVTLSSTFSPSVPAIGFTDARKNGVVYADGSKQTEAGRKYVPGFGGSLAIHKTYAYISGSSEQLVWIASKNDVNAFRGTFRMQQNDSAVGMHLYDIVGATYQGGGSGGDTEFVATPLIQIPTTTPYTFRIEKGADGHLRLYATNPSGFTGYSYITWDITEFGYTSD